MSLLDRFRSFFSSIEELDQAVEEAELEEEQADATHRANRTFDRWGPSERDTLPGSPRGRRYWRRR